jgi:hypothetical protein
LLHQKLEIDPNARVAYKLIDTGVVILDLATETAYTVIYGNPQPAVIPFQLSQNIKNIISATDEQLKERWSESKRDGWSDERETVFTELAYRGVNMLGSGFESRRYLQVFVRDGSEPGPALQASASTTSALSPQL